MRISMTMAKWSNSIGHTRNINGNRRKHRKGSKENENRLGFLPLTKQELQVREKTQNSYANKNSMLSVNNVVDNTYACNIIVLS